MLCNDHDGPKDFRCLKIGRYRGDREIDSPLAVVREQRHTETMMSLLEKLQIIAQMIGIAGLLITLLINYRQVRLVYLQMQEMRRSTTAQHILSLLNFIESDEIRAALSLVYTTLHKTPFTDWTEDQRLAASKLCSSFSSAGTVLQSGLVPLEPVIEGWEHPLRRCYQVLEPYIREMQKPENAGPHYWAAFDWLYGQIGFDPEQAPATKRGSGDRRPYTA